MAAGQGCVIRLLSQRRQASCPGSAVSHCSGGEELGLEAGNTGVSPLALIIFVTSYCSGKEI